MCQYLAVAYVHVYTIEFSRANHLFSLSFFFPRTTLTFPMMRTLHTLLYPGELCVVVVHVQDPKWVLLCTFLRFPQITRKTDIWKKMRGGGSLWVRGVHPRSLCAPINRRRRVGLCAFSTICVCTSPSSLMMWENSKDQKSTLQQKECVLKMRACMPDRLPGVANAILV